MTEKQMQLLCINKINKLFIYIFDHVSQLTFHYQIICLSISKCILSVQSYHSLREALIGCLHGLIDR